MNKKTEQRTVYECQNGGRITYQPEITELSISELSPHFTAVPLYMKSS